MDISFADNNFCSSIQLRRAIEEEEKEKRQQLLDEERKLEKSNAPIIKELQFLVQQGNEQIKVLQEENEMQKQQIVQLEKREISIQKEAKVARIRGFVSFFISTVIAIASLIVAILK